MNQVSIGLLFLIMWTLAVSGAHSADVNHAAREMAAKQATTEFIQSLKSELTAAMQAGGPAHSIKVCSEIAPAIAGRLSRENGWRVTRVGTLVRNPMLGTPDAWEQAVLDKFIERHDKGERFEKMAYSEVVDEPGGRYFRFMKAIPVGAPCLACHGERDALSAEVKQVLNNQYPYDQATGYQLGELRGAVSIKQPLSMELRQGQN